MRRWYVYTCSTGRECVRYHIFDTLNILTCAGVGKRASFEQAQYFGLSMLLLLQAGLVAHPSLSSPLLLLLVPRPFSLLLPLLLPFSSSSLPLLHPAASSSPCPVMSTPCPSHAKSDHSRRYCILERP
ncbi:hypothetical protein H105_01357 [Trichophyton soudanense CBS 452.61]|uniref:Uncharacterized protein n=1 Tax=Trichophyton soudanense CBS 452.61 TaxID=1215331 RepID=A0A022Y3F8_TRISD|nr:hypothetical protein H105_01357 [Trichophyton soudanense CBS 452.61]